MLGNLNQCHRAEVFRLYVAGLEDPGGIDDLGEGSSNNSSIMEADDVQLQAIESDESL